MAVKWFVTCLAAVAFNTPAVAQEVVGTSIIGNREVQLLSNNTWRYVTPTSASTEPNCWSVEKNISFCGEKAGWSQTSPGGKSPEIAAMFRLDDRNYGEFIVENLGSDDGISREFMRSAVITNAANASHVQAKDIATFGVEAAQVNGLPGETLTYAMKSEGLSVVFINTVVISKHQTVQVATFHIGQVVTGEMKLAHKQFIDATRLK